MGGEGTRFREVYEGPKPLYKLYGKYPLLYLNQLPFFSLWNEEEIEEIIFTVAKWNVSKELIPLLPSFPAQLYDFFLFLHEKYDFIEKPIFDWDKVKVKLIVEDQRLGRGGSILKGLKERTIDKNQAYLVQQPDDLVSFDLKKFLKAKEEEFAALMFCSTYFQSPFGVGVVEGEKIVRFEEKPKTQLLGLNNERFVLFTGYSYYKPELFEELLNQSYPFPFNLENTLIPSLAEKGRIRAIYTKNWFSLNSRREVKIVESYPEKDLIKILYSSNI